MNDVQSSPSGANGKEGGQSQQALSLQGMAIDPYSRNLGRGKACDACRRRKLRCDGARPSCGRCVEARNRKLDALRRKGVSENEVRSITFPPCYNDGEPSDASIFSEARNNAFSAYNTGATPSSLSAQSSVGSSNAENKRPMKKKRMQSITPSKAKAEGEGAAPNDLFFAEILSSQLPLEASARSIANGHTADAPRSIAFVPYGGPETIGSKEPTQVAQAEASTSLTVAYALGQPDVPLPPPAQLDHLITVCYEEHQTACIFHPERLRERLAHPADHPDYPHRAALHILAALAYAARPELDDGPSAPTNRSGAHYRHTMAARHHIRTATHMGFTSNALDLARASILLVFKLYGMGDQMESYLASSAAVRMAIALNANRDVLARVDQEEQQLQFTLLQPRITDGSIMQVHPRDEIEAEEVRRMMLLMFVADRAGIAATLWPGAIAEEDYTAELPRATVQEFLSTTTSNVSSQPWTTRRNPLSIQSPDFFSRPAADPEQFFYKGSVLMGRCGLYVSRLSRNAEPAQITSSSRFQQIESWIAALHLEASDMAKAAAVSRAASGGGAGLSGHLGGHHSGAPMAARKAEGSLTTYLLSTSGEPRLYKGMIITSSLIPYTCTLIIHEPIANLAPESEAMCRAATRGVISILRVSEGIIAPTIA